MCIYQNLIDWISSSHTTVKIKPQLSFMIGIKKRNVSENNIISTLWATMYIHAIILSNLSKVKIMQKYTSQWNPAQGWKLC